MRKSDSLMSAAMSYTAQWNEVFKEMTAYLEEHGDLTMRKSDSKKQLLALVDQKTMSQKKVGQKEEKQI